MNDIIAQTCIGFCIYLVIDYFAIALVEYIGHRWFMHRPNAINMAGYKTHHVEHHGKGLNDHSPHIDLRLRDTLPFAAPFLLFSSINGTISGRLWGFYYPYGAIPALLLTLAVHHRLYSLIHRCEHDLEHNWTERLPWFQEMKRHHLDHHRKPNRNFAVVFLWTDRLFGTYWRSADGTAARDRIADVTAAGYRA